MTLTRSLSAIDEAWRLEAALELHREAAALQSADRLVVRMSGKTSRGYSVAWADFAKLQTRTISDLPALPLNQTVERYFVRGHFVVGSS